MKQVGAVVVIIVLVGFAYNCRGVHVHDLPPYSQRKVDFKQGETVDTAPLSEGVQANQKNRNYARIQFSGPPGSHFFDEPTEGLLRGGAWLIDNHYYVENSMISKTDAWTYMFWVKPNGGEGCLLQKGDSPVISISSGGIKVQVRDSRNLAGGSYVTTSPLPGGWTLVTVVVSQGRLEVWFNNQVAASEWIPDNVLNTQKVRFGCTGGTANAYVGDLRYLPRPCEANYINDVYIHKPSYLI